MASRAENAGLGVGKEVSKPAVGLLLGVFQHVSPSCHELQAMCPEGSQGRPRREGEAARMGRAGDSLHRHPPGKSEPTVSARRFLVWQGK